MTDDDRARTSISPEVRRRVILWFVKAIVGMPVIGLVLFVVAGTFRWWWGWLFLGLSVWAVFAHGLVLARVNPGLLAQRSKAMYEIDAPLWDKCLVWLGAGTLSYLGWFVAAMDLRHGWTDAMPTGLRVAAVAVWVTAWTWILWASVANRFFTTTVGIQAGHTVQDTGPYRYVRHPGYVGAVVYLLATPLVLGSWWALIPAALAGGCFVLRTALEDRFLHTRLDGYRDYASRVRYRLLPGVW